MSIFKRGRVYWYHFVFNGTHVQESTKQGNTRVARQMEAAHRTALAKGEAGFREKKIVPTLSEFIECRFEPWAKASFEQSSPKTWLGWYRTHLRTLASYGPLSGRKLDQITSEHAADFAAHRQAQGLQPSSINAALRVLRRVCRMAVEWGIIDAAPKIKLLRGERHRERVISREEEARYLAAAHDPLASIATVLIDTGMRPEECFRLRWESVAWENGSNGTLLVTHGKTAAARRVLPMSPRVRAVLDEQWDGQKRPEEGWVWPAPTASAHVEPSTVRKQHRRALRESGLRPFVLYSLRHTFLTRLGESGCNVWTLARVAGHNSIAMSARYVHPSDEAVVSAISQLETPQAGGRAALAAATDESIN